MNYQDIQYFELEAIQEGPALGQEGATESRSHTSSSSSTEYSWTPSKCSNGSWYGRRDKMILFARSAIVIVTLLVLIVNIRPTQENPSLQQQQDIPFGVDDSEDPNYCVILRHDIMDPGFMPYGVELDRSYCEERDSHLMWLGTLRCYNVKYRWCFAGLSDGFTVDDLQGHHGGCQIEFYEKDGNVYNYDGRKMPESFKSKCDAPKSQLWYSTQPIEGCGKSRLEFCNSDGSLNWDLIHQHKNAAGRSDLRSGLTKAYNCREYQLIDWYDEDCRNDQDCASHFEQLCEEQQQGCANRLYRGCDGNGHISQELANSASEECLMFDEIDFNMVGHKTDQGVDLVCLSPEWHDDDI